MDRTYRNPVYATACPDPFVLKHRGEYWCYCTGDWHDGRRFGILHSPDLVHWRDVGGALAPLPEGHPYYWAPEVCVWQGRCYLYYSVGNEELMEIRVAVADTPAGPFVDSGHRLTTEPFAIDAHVFEDDDGARYLFYAVDFLDHSHIGTGTVMDRLVDPFTLAGQARPVTRAQHDWQVYDPQRASKGGVRWHTVEGSTVLKRKGLYYQMFSGGNWQNVSYGVSYATTDDLTRPDEWTQHADGALVLPILRTVPDQVVGPGHNSAVRGPDNQQLYCVYHRWALDINSRVMCIDPLDWAGDRLIVLGPTNGTQPAPLLPTLAGFAAAPDGGLSAPWRVAGGAWTLAEDALHQTATDGQAAVQVALPPAAVVEVTARTDASSTLAGEEGDYGIALSDDGGPLLSLVLPATGGTATVEWRDATGNSSRQALWLPDAFRPDGDHLLRLEIDGGWARLSVDGIATRWSGAIGGRATDLALVTRRCAATFAGFALTTGWQDLFDEACSLDDLGWHGTPADAWTMEAGALQSSGRHGEAVIGKEHTLTAYAAVINAQLTGPGPNDTGYDLRPADAGQGPGLVLRHQATGWALALPDGSAWPLLDPFAPEEVQQFRFLKRDGQVSCWWEGRLLGTLPATPGPTRVALATTGAAVAFEMVRVTAL